MADVKARITLQDGTHLDIDKFNGLRTIESLSQSTGQPKDIYYGVVPNSGEIELIDIKGEIENLVRSGDIENSNLPIELLVNNKPIQHHIANDSNYTNERNLNLSLVDELSLWDSFIYAGRQLTDSITLYDLLVEIFTQLDYSNTDIDEMLLGKVSSSQFGET